MHQSTSPGGLGSYTQMSQDNNVAQGAYRPYMRYKRAPKAYQNLWGVYYGGSRTWEGRQSDLEMNLVFKINSWKRFLFYMQEGRGSDSHPNISQYIYGGRIVQQQLKSQLLQANVFLSARTDCFERSWFLFGIFYDGSILYQNCNTLFHSLV